MISESLPNASSDFKFCHSAVIAENEGRLYASWYIYPKEENKDARIVLTSCSLVDKKWDRPEIMFDGFSEKSFGNPVLFTDDNQVLNILFVILKGEYWNSAESFHSKLDPKTKEWSTPVKTNLPFAMMLRHRPVYDLQGNLYLPAYDEEKLKTVIYKMDGDPTKWTEVQRFEKSLIQGDIAIISHRHWIMYFRTANDDFNVFLSESYDQGKSWSEPEKTSMFCPKSGVAAAYDPSSKNMFVTTNQTQEIKRYPLNVFVSRDSGRSYTKNKIVNNESVELSYPTMLRASDEKIHLLYTYKRLFIKYSYFDSSDFQE